MLTTLILIRHGNTNENENGIFGGSMDAPLNDQGRFKAQKLGEALSNREIHLIYSSTYLKAVETAKCLMAEKRIPLVLSEELNEIEGGAWQDKSWSEIRESWPHEYALWFNEAFKVELPDGESMDEFRDRFIGKVRHIVNQNIGKTLCIVTHQYALSMLMSYFKGLDYHLMNVTQPFGFTSVSIVTIDQGKFTVEKEADVSHLR